MIRLCIAGATGWTGSALAAAVQESASFELSGAVARTAAGLDLGSALGLEPWGVIITATVAEALRANADVLIDYSHPAAVKEHTLTALQAGVSVVIGTSGFTLAFETVFGLPDERLIIRHDAGTSAKPYVAGTLLAVERALTLKGLIRGLDTLLFQ